MSAYRRILAAVDGSGASNKGLREAIRLAKAERARLVILHVMDEYPAFAAMDAAMSGAPGEDLVPFLRQGAKRVLARAKKAADAAGVRATTVLREILGGPAAPTIVREARKAGAQLIVLGTHGRRGVRRMVMGSDAEQVVRNASVPVLLVRA